MLAGRCVVAVCLSLLLTSAAAAREATRLVHVGAVRQDVLGITFVGGGVERGRQVPYE